VCDVATLRLLGLRHHTRSAKNRLPDPNPQPREGPAERAALQARSFRVFYANHKGQKGIRKKKKEGKKKQTSTYPQPTSNRSYHHWPREFSFPGWPRRPRGANPSRISVRPTIWVTKVAVLGAPRGRGGPKRVWRRSSSFQLDFPTAPKTSMVTITVSGRIIEQFLSTLEEFATGEGKPGTRRGTCRFFEDGRRWESAAEEKFQQIRKSLAAGPSTRSPVLPAAYNLVNTRIYG